MSSTLSQNILAPKTPQNLSEQKEKITIKRLLTMSSELDCNDWDKNQQDKKIRFIKEGLAPIYP